MSLTGGTTLALVVILALLAPVGTAVAWNRAGSRAWLRWPARVGMLLLCEITACVAVAAGVNDAGQFYTSWSELLGGSSGVALEHAKAGAADPGLYRQLAREHRRGKSLIITVQVPDAGAATVQQALVYLPKEYFDSAYAAAQFPVVELLDGFPGSPRSWTGPLDLQRIADAEIAAHRTVPFVAVMPNQNYLGRHDGECIDQVRGPQVETTLTQNVRSVIERDFRVMRDRSGWSVVGYSTGGYCATNIVMRHPDLFGSAVSLSGDGPYQDWTTGNLFRGSIAARDANDPIWRATHLPDPPIALLLASGAQDRGVLTRMHELAARLHHPTRVYLFTLPHGGHNAVAWRAMEPAVFDWLATVLPPPLVPPVVVQGVRPTPAVPDAGTPPTRAVRASKVA